MEQNQNLDFIKEQVKERPINRKKLMRRTVLTASMAVIFGLIACLTFLLLEPVISNMLYPEEEVQKIQLKTESEEEEKLPEDMLLEEQAAAPTINQEITRTVVEKVQLEVSDYQSLYRKIYANSQKVSIKSMVTVTGVTSDVDWFDNIHENNGQSAGLIVAESGRKFLILVDSRKIADADHLLVTFSDNTQVRAQLEITDEETGLAIVSVRVVDIPASTKAILDSAVLGNSGSSLLAAPVVALGRPLGNTNSVIYGMVTSTDSFSNLEDYNIRILTTDIAAADNSSGVLISLSGQVVGILQPAQMKADTNQAILTAYSAADLRSILEKLINGEEIAHIGILGTDVPREVHEELGVPMGVFVTEISMDSPAMTAGIQSGDVIVRIGTAEIATYNEYQRTLQELSPEMSTTVTVMRQGPEGYEEMTLDIIIGK